MSFDKRTRKVIKKIYRCPYLPVSELKLMFPDYPDIDDLLCWLESEKYISFRIASGPSEDEGYECGFFDERAHILSLRKGNIEAEDRTAFRANLALAISGLAILISFLSFIFNFVI